MIDAGTGEIRTSPSSLATLLGTARWLHETLLMEAGWLVILSTTAMLVIALLGILMGWPRFANTLAGWHNLPLIVLSPLTGLLMAAGVTFTSLPPASGGQVTQLKLTEAVEILGRDHDLSALIWLRPQGGRLLVRLAEDGEYRLYGLTASGATPLERNWPRLWHEGNFAGAWSAAMNMVLSVAMIGLLVTGVWIWSSRKLRRWKHRFSRAAAN